MLCYYYPPVQSSGTARSVAFSRLLPRLGWEPTVLTVRRARERWSSRHGAPPDGIRVVRSPEWDLTGLIDLLQGVTNRVFRFVGHGAPRNLYRQFLGFPDPQSAWLTVLPGVGLARAHHVVYASCPPFSSAVSALLIGVAARRPVVLDFRDPWAYQLVPTFSQRYERAVLRLEALAVRRCDALIVNTRGVQGLYAKRYPFAAHKIVTIPNGYDDLTPVAAIEASAFRIVHAGTFYGGRDPIPLMEALLRIKDPRIEFVHVGEPYPALETYRGRIALHQLGLVPRHAALETVRSASLLYFCQGPGHSLSIPAKAYEYLATGLPILAHCPEGDAAELVRTYGKNSTVVTSDGVALEEAVRALLGRWPHTEPAIDPEFTRRHSREELTRQLVHVLESVL